MQTIRIKDLVQAVIKDFLALTDDFSEKALNRRFKTPLNFAAAMVRTGRADALAAGIIHTTGEVILAAQQFIGMHIRMGRAATELDVQTAQLAFAYQEPEFLPDI